jgi:hypothetical protein
MTTITVESVLLRASTTLQDDGYVRWPKAELLNYLNDGQRELVKIKPDAKTKTVTVALASGAKQTNPSDCIEIIELRQNDNGAVVLPCDRKALDAFSPNWMRTPTASTVKHYMDDPQPETFYVYPAQNATPATVVMTYVALPALVGETNNIDVRDIHAERLVNYIIYRAKSKDAETGDVAMATAAYALFKE